MDNITSRDKQTGLEMAWHKKTNVVPVVTKHNSGIIYPMEKQPLFLGNGTKTEFYSIVSKDDNLPIGNPVGKGYSLISNEKIWDLVEAALKGTTHKITSVGTVAGRAKCFVSVKLSENIMAAGRDTRNVLNILWGHGGAMSVQARTGLTVVVCENTFNMALKERGDFTFYLRHSGNAEAKLEGMGKAIDAHYGVVTEFQTAMDTMAKHSVKISEARKIFAGFIVRDGEVDEVSTRTSNQIDRLMALFQNGKGNNGKDFADVFNATTDYFSHESSGGEDKMKQFESSEFGMGQTRKSEMFHLLRGESVVNVGDLATVMKRGDKVLNLI